jgi:DNA-binding transcriptional ArsR family regulator
MTTGTPSSPASTPDGVAVLDDDQRVAAVLSPLRRELLARLQVEPDSATGLARKLALPRQKLNYHLRELERVGLVELVEARPRRGVAERILRPTARAWVISPALLEATGQDPAAVRDQFSSSYLLSSAARTVRDAAELLRGAARAKKALATFTLETEVSFATPASRAEFADELAAAVARLVTKHHDPRPGSRAFRFVIGGHPVVARKTAAATLGRTHRTRRSAS